MDDPKYIVLVRSWSGSWYSVHDTYEEAFKAWQSAAHHYPNAWLIEGTVMERHAYGTSKEPR